MIPYIYCTTYIETSTWTGNMGCLKPAARISTITATRGGLAISSDIWATPDGWCSAGLKTCVKGGPTYVKNTTARSVA